MKNVLDFFRSFFNQQKIYFKFFKNVGARWLLALWAIAGVTVGVAPC